MRVLPVTANNRKFDRRFWKVLIVTLVQVLLLIGIALTLVHFFIGSGPISRLLFQFVPVVGIGIGIKVVRDKLQ